MNSTSVQIHVLMWRHGGEYETLQSKLNSPQPVPPLQKAHRLILQLSAPTRSDAVPDASLQRRTKRPHKTETQHLCLETAPHPANQVQSFRPHRLDSHCGL